MATAHGDNNATHQILLDESTYHELNMILTDLKTLGQLVSTIDMKELCEDEVSNAGWLIERTAKRAQEVLNRSPKAAEAVSLRVIDRPE